MALIDNKPKKSCEVKNGPKGNRKSKVELAASCVRNVTVEPLVGFYIVSSVLASLATQNLNLDKACRVNLKFNSTVCDALAERATKNYSNQEMEVQQLVAGMSIWKTFVQSFIPAILIVFLGSWSDRNRRRKPLMLIPVLGEFSTVMGLLLCTYFFYQLPMEVAGIFESLFPAITGGWMTMFMAVFSYIGDITKVESRTFRIGVVNVFCSVGIPIGTALSGISFKLLGYYGVFSVSAVMYILGFSYGVFFIKDSTSFIPPATSSVKSENNNNNHLTNNNVDIPVLDAKPVKSSPSFSCFTFLKDLFDFKHLNAALKVTFKGEDKNRRKKILLLMVAIIVVMGPLYGEMHVSYLYARYRFNWNELDFSIFSTFSMVTNLVGTLISMVIFTHVLKIDDSLIGVMSCLSKILAGLMFAFAPTEFIYYMGALVDIINGTSFIAVRSIISKLVPAEELGKVNSIFGVSEAMVPLIYGPMYSAVYGLTIHVLPGAFYLLGGVLTLPAVFIFIWIYFDDKRAAKRAVKGQASCHEKNQGIVTISTCISDRTVSESNLENKNNHNSILTGVSNPAFQEEILGIYKKVVEF